MSEQCRVRGCAGEGRHPIVIEIPAEIPVQDHHQKAYLCDECYRKAMVGGGALGFSVGGKVVRRTSVEAGGKVTLSPPPEGEAAPEEA